MSFFSDAKKYTRLVKKKQKYEQLMKKAVEDKDKGKFERCYNIIRILQSDIDDLMKKDKQ